jgi:hypothetical protein
MSPQRPPAPATEHAHRDEIRAAATLTINRCVAGHAVVLALLDKDGRIFADAHVPLEGLEEVIASMRRVASELGGAKVGHG